MGIGGGHASDSGPAFGGGPSAPAGDPGFDKEEAKRAQAEADAKAAADAEQLRQSAAADQKKRQDEIDAIQQKNDQLKGLFESNRERDLQRELQNKRAARTDYSARTILTGKTGIGATDGSGTAKKTLLGT